jgi:UDP-N-acetyl-D-galactosamine dehydrogenase
VALSSKHNVVGYDIRQSRIKELRRGRDRTGEVSDQELKKAKSLALTDSIDEARDGASTSSRCQRRWTLTRLPVSGH